MKLLRHGLLVLLLALAPLAGHWHALSHLGSVHGEAPRAGLARALTASDAINASALSEAAPALSADSHEGPGASSGCPGCGAWAQLTVAIPPACPAGQDCAAGAEREPPGHAPLALAAAPRRYATRAPPFLS